MRGKDEGAVDRNKMQGDGVERNKSEADNFAYHYRVRVECPKECETKLNGEN